MPVKGVKQAKKNTRKVVGKITDDLTPKTITEVLIIAQGYAAAHVPVDLGALSNSLDRNVEKSGDGWRGALGHYGVLYAARVHNAAGKLRGQRRPKIDGIERGLYWDPNGEPQWLTRAFEVHGRNQIRDAIRRGYKL